MAQTIQAATKVATKAMSATIAAPAAPASVPADNVPADNVPADNAPADRVATRMCPTRADGAEPLFQHRLTVSQCSSKQRAQYHKCFTCSHGCDRG